MATNICYILFSINMVINTEIIIYESQKKKITEKLSPETKRKKLDSDQNAINQRTCRFNGEIIGEKKP